MSKKRDKDPTLGSESLAVWLGTLRRLCSLLTLTPVVFNRSYQVAKSHHDRMMPICVIVGAGGSYLYSYRACLLELYGD